VHLGVRVAAEPAGYLDPLLFLPSPGTDEQPVQDGPGAATSPVPVAVEVSAPPPDSESLPLASTGGGTPGGAQADTARVDDVGQLEAGAAPLEPLAVAAGTSVAASDSGLAPPAAPEASGRPPDASPSVAEAAPAAASRPRRSKPAATSPPAEARSPGATSESRSRERQREPASEPRTPTAARIMAAKGILGRSAPRVDPRPGVPPRREGTIRREGTATAPDVTGRAASRIPRSGDREWAWLAPIGASIGICALAVVVLRRRGGGPASGDGERSPNLPSAVTTLLVEGPPALPAVRPPAGRGLRGGSPRPRRRLDRGGPGTPGTRVPSRVRERRASV
jgi:hypothetical protein